MTVHMQYLHANTLIQCSKDAYPKEACGVLVGRVAAEGVFVDSVHELVNVAINPHRGYELNEGEIAHVAHMAARYGRRIVGYWHSHPGGLARPSQRDEYAARANVLASDVVHIIVTATSFGEGVGITAGFDCAWRWSEQAGKYVPVPIELQ